MENEELEIKNREYQEEIERILKENKYLDNYEYAKYVIEAFISDDRNYQRGRFFRITRINRKIFDYCVELIKFLNPNLYQEYLEAQKQSQENKINNMKSNIYMLAMAIETGHFPDGSKYDILDFFRFVPFIESGFNFARDLKEFMLSCDDLDEGVYETITRYIEENNILGMKFATEKNILKDKTIFDNDPRVTPKVVHNCYRYMFAMGVPKIEAAFRIVLKRYLNKEISFGDLSKMENRSKKRKYEKSYHNPHKLKLAPEYLEDKK